MTFSPESQGSFNSPRKSEEMAQPDNSLIESGVFMEAQAGVLNCLFNGDEARLVNWLNENRENGEFIRQSLTEYIDEHGNIPDTEQFAESIRNSVPNLNTSH